jgi:hypothetical protein
MAWELDNLTNPFGYKKGAQKPVNNMSGLLDFAMQANQYIPVSGDIQSGILAANDLSQGNYSSAALNAVGLLPFIPSLGTVKNVNSNDINIIRDSFKNAVIENRKLKTPETLSKLNELRETLKNAESSIYSAPINEAADTAQKGLLNYGMQHRPPMKDGGAPLFDLTGGGNIYPSDVYSKNAIQYYGTGDKNLDAKSFSIVNKFKNNPDAEVEIYRAIPKDVNASINSGDWITINKDYAKQHGQSVLEGNYKIVKKKVKAKDIFTNGDSIHEFGYDPQN